jgi:hypothetical protein
VDRVLDVPVKCVGVPLRQIRGAKLRHGTSVLRNMKPQIPSFQEKPLSFSLPRPYRKPTQVGRMRILRRLRELRRRNSAN